MRLFCKSIFYERLRCHQNLLGYGSRNARLAFIYRYYEFVPVVYLYVAKRKHPEITRDIQYLSHTS
jgi:hypothetical protein